MALKTRAQLRPKFANFKKPPQEDFWDWQESYWHKLDNIDASKVVATIDGHTYPILTLIQDNEFIRGVQQLQQLLQLMDFDDHTDLRRIVNIELNLEWAEL